MAKKRTPKYYLVLSKGKNYTYGAFPYTEEGKQKAEVFIKKAAKTKGENLYIKEE